MNTTAWQRKLDALYRLARDQADKPEGELAGRKIDDILSRYPQLKSYKPGFIFGDVTGREITLGDVRWMDRNGVNTQGEWEGEDMIDAIRKMMADYRGRIVEFKNKRALTEMKFLPKGIFDDRDNASLQV